MKILILIFLSFCFNCYGQIDYLQPIQVKNITRLSQLIDSSNNCKIGSFRLYFQSQGKDLQIIDNKGDAFNARTLETMKRAVFGDIFRFVRIKNINCAGITDTFTLHIQANKSPITSSPEKIQQISSVDELFSTFSQKDWKPNCTVDRYTLYYTKHRQDPVEILCQGDTFNNVIKMVLAAAKKGDQYIFKLTNGNCASFSVGIHIE